MESACYLKKENSTIEFNSNLNCEAEGAVFFLISVGNTICLMNSTVELISGVHAIRTKWNEF